MPNTTTKISRTGQVTVTGQSAISGGTYTRTVGYVRRMDRAEVGTGALTWEARKGKRGTVATRTFDTRAQAVAWLAN